MMKKIKQMWWPTVVGLIPLVMGAVLYNQLPNRIPIHYNVNGLPDNYAGKLFGVVFLPLLLIAVNFLIFITREHARQKNKRLNEIIIWIVPLLALVLQPTTLLTALGYQLNVMTIVMITVGVIFMVLGNYIPKASPNRTVGFRFKTTLTNPENWQKTNRLGGIMMVISGLLFIIGGVLGMWNVMFAIGALVISMILTVVVPIVYSIKLHKHFEM
ncbi:DUF1648 domain-containing protein [Periweissella cryptocerci]|uniref:DUF1648 domain-containing protein n=1 Tax=Periweissella cryptocerci TaxID=2506420 RepID=A0A4P6YVS1_9LACO|nr:SdpI family protein [Periweissella cryptocerci]QBO36856.1 DUF1648 domain-containing protein [Periweissella cryptocerci]